MNTITENSKQVFEKINIIFEKFWKNNIYGNIINFCKKTGVSFGNAIILKISDAGSGSEERYFGT